MGAGGGGRWGRTESQRREGPYTWKLWVRVVSKCRLRFRLQPPPSLRKDPLFFYFSLFLLPGSQTLTLRPLSHSSFICATRASVLLDVNVLVTCVTNTRFCFVPKPCIWFYLVSSKQQGLFWWKKKGLSSAILIRCFLAYNFALLPFLNNCIRRSKCWWFFFPRANVDYYDNPPLLH